MRYYQSPGELVIKSWCEKPEDTVLSQASNLAKLPFAFKQICLMPDTHLGYGMPIGGVLATQEIVIPNCVGVDIGCGLCAVKTSVNDLDISKLKLVLGKMRKAIPVGFNKHKILQDEKLMPNSPMGLITEQNYHNALFSLGTLGSGNHFENILKDKNGFLWIMIHSGSRNLGKRVADYYNKLAIEANKKYFSEVLKEWQLAFLPIKDEMGQEYLKEMNYCIEFALANRTLMLSRIMEIFDSVYDSVKFDSVIDIAHNYARIENHFGKNVMVHRKGATSARKGETGIISGSQGTPSYIVQGRGNPESFMSCSHGAGRRMGRKQAKEELNLKEEIRKLDDLNILHEIRGKSDLDEACGAFKDINTVMKEQEDLVGILVELKPLAVVKG